MLRCVDYNVGIPDVTIENLSIEKEGELLHQWSANDVRAMLKKEKAVKGSSEWIIDPDGVVLVDRFEVNHCPKQSG